MIGDEVEIKSGHWCVTLVNESGNHNEMAEGREGHLPM